MRNKVTPIVATDKNGLDIFIKRLECPICRSSSSKTLFNSSYSNNEMVNYLKLEQTFGDEFWSDFDRGYFSGQSFTVAKCNNCEFIYQACILSNTGMKRLYDIWIDPQITFSRHSTLDLCSKSTVHAQRLNILLRNFSYQKNINVLDWGGGFGDFCSMAQCHHINVAALEFSDERKLFLENRGIQVLRPGELQENFYHFINIDQVLEHVADPVGVLKKIRNYLRDDGILYVSVPKCNTVEKLLGSGDLSDQTFSCLSLQHINAFTNRTLKTACKAANYRVLHVNNPQPGLIFSNKNIATFTVELIKNLIRPINYHFFNTSLFLAKKN